MSTHAALAVIEGAVGFVLAAGRRVDGPLLAAGLVLHVLADVVRNAGWHGVLRAAGPGLRTVRLRDVEVAAFAGSAANAVVPVRGGDLVKVLLIRRCAPAAPIATVASTLVVESLVESAAGALLLAWALWHGLVPLDALTGTITDAGDRPLIAAAAALAAAVAIGAGAVLVRRRARRVMRDLASGIAVLRSPRMLLVRVAGPQLAGRAVRLLAIACCLSALGLPATAAAAALTMAIDAGTRVGFAPATAGLRVALLVYGLPAATGAAVSVGAVVAYIATTRVARTIVSFAIATAVLVATLGCSPRRALAAVRRLPRAAAEPLSADPGALPAEAVRPRA